MFPIQDSVPRRCPPLMTWGLITVNVLIFYLETGISEPELERLIYGYGIVPAKITDYLDWNGIGGVFSDAIMPFFTSMFIHGGWVHIIGNMWILWIFGDNVEDEMGPLRFLIFYLLCGLCAGIVHVVSNPGSLIPTVGASGAIAGVMGAYFVLFPRARIIMMIPIFIFPFFFEIPAYFFLAYWFVQQVFSGAISLVAAGNVSGIAWWAHAGGFIFGVIIHRLFIYVRPVPCRRNDSMMDHPWGIWSSGERF